MILRQYRAPIKNNNNGCKNSNKVKKRCADTFFEVRKSSPSSSFVTNIVKSKGNIATILWIFAFGSNGCKVNSFAFIVARVFWAFPNHKIFFRHRFCELVHANTSNKTGLDVRGYPTTVSEQYSISFSSVQKDVSIDLFDIQGQLIQTWKEQDVDLITLPMEHHAPGYYLVRLSTMEGQRSLKFVKLTD